jgi:hypothetical protein
VRVTKRPTGVVVQTRCGNLDVYNSRFYTQRNKNNKSLITALLVADVNRMTWVCTAPVVLPVQSQQPLAIVAMQPYNDNRHPICFPGYPEGVTRSSRFSPKVYMIIAQSIRTRVVQAHCQWRPFKCRRMCGTTAAVKRFCHQGEGDVADFLTNTI